MRKADAKEELEQLADDHVVSVAAAVIDELDEPLHVGLLPRDDDEGQRLYVIHPEGVELVYAGDWNPSGVTVRRTSIGPLYGLTLEERYLTYRKHIERVDFHLESVSIHDERLGKMPLEVLRTRTNGDDEFAKVVTLLRQWARTPDGRGGSAR